MKTKSFQLDSSLLVFIVLFIILIIYLLFYNYYNQKCHECKQENEQNQEMLRKKIENLEKTISINNADESNDLNIVRDVNYVRPVLPTLNGITQNNPQTLNSLDRVFNPLRFPYKSDYFYDQNWYPNLSLPSQVVGCGARNTPCLGGTQVPIYNPTTAREISNTNIAPVYISTRGPLGQPQQVGILYKVYGDENDTLPLYGRKKYPNQDNYEYYTLLGNYGAKVPVVTQNKNFELGTNDVVFIKGRSEPYRVTIYESDFPQYIPYL